MELAALGEGLLTPEQTLSHIGTWVLFPPLLPLQYTLALAWGGGGGSSALLPDNLKTIVVSWFLESFKTRQLKKVS